MPEKQLRRMNAHYALIQGLFWGGYATIWAFLTVLLLYRGFSNSQIGVVSFLALTLPIVVQPGLAALADRDGRFTSRRLGLTLVCLAATAAGVMWAWGANRLLTAVLYVLIGVCLTATQPFFSSMAMEWQMAGADLNFGLGRGIGSACYAALVLLLGQLTERYAPTLVVPVFAGLFAILALAVWRFRSAPAPRMEGEAPGSYQPPAAAEISPVCVAACGMRTADGVPQLLMYLYDPHRGEGRGRVRSHGCGFGIGGVSGAAGYGTVQPDAAEAVSGMAAASVRRCVSGEDRSFLAGGVYDRHLSGIGAAIF